MVEIHCIKNARNENSTFDLSWTLVFEWTVRCLQTVQFLVMFGQEKCSGGLKFDFGPKWEIQICLIVVFFVDQNIIIFQQNKTLVHLFHWENQSKNLTRQHCLRSFSGLSVLTYVHIYLCMFEISAQKTQY